jgi:hypothetical protein
MLVVIVRRWCVRRRRRVLLRLRRCVLRLRLRL